MTVYSLFGQPAAPASLSVDPAGYTMAMQFKLTKPAYLTGIWFYSAPGAVSLPSAVGIFQVSGQTLVASQVPSWSGAVGSGWIKATFPGTDKLLPGVSYKVAVQRGDGGNWYSSTAHYWDTGAGGSGLTSGIIVAPNNAGADVGQDSFNVAAGGGLVYPLSTFNATNYWVDVEVTTNPTPFATQVTARNPGLFLENDETSGTVAYDSSGNLRPGTYVGTPTLGDPSLLTSGEGKSWSPANATSWITRAGEAWMNPASGGVSVLQLFKLSALPPSLGALFARDDASGLNRHWVFYVTAAGGFRILNTTTTLSNQDNSSAAGLVSVGTKYCVAMVWDYASTSIKTYLMAEGGSPALVWTISGMTGVETSDVARPFTVGALDNRSDLAWYHRGDLKGTAFYPSVLSLADFTAIANAALGSSGLLAEYGFNEGSGTTTADSSGHGHTGTLAGSAAWTAPGHASTPAAVFNPTGRADGSGLTVPRTGLEPGAALTVMAWVYLAVNDGTYVVAVSKGRAAAGDSYALYAHDSSLGKPTFYFNTTVGEFKVGVPSVTMLGAWHHLAGTYDGANGKVYLDGVLVNTLAATGTIVYDSTDLGLMTSLSFPGESMTGELDDVRIYDVALTGAEIATLMNTPVGGAPPASGPSLLMASGVPL